MKCNNCGNVLSADSKFCQNCGKEITEPKKEDNMKISNLSKVSIGFLIAQFVIPVLSSIVKYLPDFIANYLQKIFNFLYCIPWIVVSLILAIISRVKYKDDASKTVLIIDIIVISTFILGLIVFFIMLVQTINGCIDYSNSKEFQDTLDACSKMGLL